MWMCLYLSLHTCVYTFLISHSPRLKRCNLGIVQFPSFDTNMTLEYSSMPFRRLGILVSFWIFFTRNIDVLAHKGNGLINH